TSGFVLFWLPTPKSGSVLGVIGKNGAGKATALRILSGELIPNLGSDNKTERSVVEFFRGKELQRYFSELYLGRLRVAVKPQYLDQLRTDQTVKEYLGEKSDKTLLDAFSLEGVLSRRLNELSGGELQKVAIVKTMQTEAEAYFFDEPASFLDVKDRLIMSKAIRRLASLGKYVVVVEHDLVVLDYLADYITIVYGEPGAYGYVSNYYGVRNGINYMLLGYLPDINMRLRSNQIVFYKHAAKEFIKTEEAFSWKAMSVSYENGFKLTIQPGTAYKGKVVGILGENGLGKTTFIKQIHSVLSSEYYKGRKLAVSYKPQTLRPNFEGTVEQLFELRKEVLDDEVYITDVYEPLRIKKLSQKSVKELSGGELQRVAVAFNLAIPADIHLLDEPSAYLDVEERLAVSKAIRRTVENRGKVAFVIDHDLAMIDYVSDYLIVVEGTPGVRGNVNPPTSLKDGLNQFLHRVNMTFRRDAETGRPRANKEDSFLDRQQKSIGEYFYESSIEEPSAETSS
ncbi:MAG: ribosome biogenesis/translation initiation ATPase RLI, partial [Thermoprotei archaeon]